MQERYLFQTADNSVWAEASYTIVRRTTVIGEELIATNKGNVEEFAERDTAWSYLSSMNIIKRLLSLRYFVFYLRLLVF